MNPSRSSGRSPLIAGVLVLLMPRLLNYVVALALIVYGLFGLNKIHQFITI